MSRILEAHHFEQVEMALPAWISSDEQRENWRNSGSMQEVYAVSDPFRED